MTTEAELRAALVRAVRDVPISREVGAASVRRRVAHRTARRGGAIAVTVMLLVVGAASVMLRARGGPALALATAPSLDLGSARVDVDLTISVDSGDEQRGLELRGESLVDFARRRAHTVLTDEAGQQFRSVTVGSTSCFMYPAPWRERLRLPTDWVCFDVFPSHRVGPALSPTADRFDDQLRAIDNGYYSDVSRVGVERVGGIVTTAYRLRASPDRIDDVRRAAGTSELSVAMSAASEQLEVWLDRGGVVRRSVSTATERSKLVATASTQRLVETPVAYGVATGAIELPPVFTRMSAADLAWRLRGASDLMPVR
jgi:hypothetical protein